MKIETYRDLTTYIQKEFDNLSDEDFTALVSETIGLYLNKPSSLLWALARIDEYHTAYKHLPIEDRPLFHLND